MFAAMLAEPALADLSTLQASVLAACPDTEFLISGYSKGAIVVHHTAEGLPQTSRDAVRGIAVFGDPNTEPKGVSCLCQTDESSDQIFNGPLIAVCGR